MKIRRIQSIGIIFLVLCMLMGCSSDETKYPSSYEKSPSPTIDQLHSISAPGNLVAQDDEGLVFIDYSNTGQGYICATLQRDPGKRVKFSITKDGEGNSPYDLTIVNKTESFPLELGNGSYLLKVYLNISGDEYAVLFTKYIDVQLENEQIPFLYPNQVVDYTKDSKAIAKAFELCKDDETVLERIATLYEYVVDNIAYDDDKAEEVDDVYILPVVDETLSTKKGICFDYAALLSAMLRSQQIPTRLVTGNTSIEYHAWVEVYLPEKGWISADVLLKSKKWSRMDPTFAASRSDYEDGYESKYYY